MKKTVLNILVFAVIMTGSLIPVPTASAIGAAPLRAELHTNQGESAEGYIIVNNTSKQDEIITANLADFFVDQNEALKFIYGYDENNKYSMQNWITIEEDDTPVAPGGERILNYTINVPEDAESHAYYGVIFVQGKSADSSSGMVSLNTEVAHLILLEVGENLTKKLSLENFTLNQYEDKPTKLVMIFKNNGNTHAAPQGKYIIKNSNDVVVDEFDANYDAYNALPERTKTIVNKWESVNDLTAGNYMIEFEGVNATKNIRASMNLDIDDEGKITVLKTSLGLEKADEKNLLGSIPFLVGGGILLLIIILLTIWGIIKKKNAKTLVILLLLFNLGITTPMALGSNNSEILITTTVERGAESSITFNGCWRRQLVGTWLFTTSYGGDAASMIQPSDRSLISTNDPQGGFYNEVGGTPDGDMAQYDNDVFIYDTCQIEITAYGYSAFDVTIKGDSGGFDNGVGHSIPDMGGYNTATFDFNLNSEDPDPDNDGGTPNNTDRYPLVDAEHGFLILNSTQTSGTTVDTFLTDDGTTAGTTYNTSKSYDAINCGVHLDRPCYHFIPEDPTEHTIIDETANSGELDADTFVVRFAASAGPTSSAGTYNQDVTFTINTTP